MYDSRVPYDKSAAIWSPDGELVQLSYARKASERGAAAVGLVIDKKTILLAGETLFDPLVVRPDKIQEIEKFLGSDPNGVDTSNELGHEIKMLEAGKKLALYLFHEALCEYGQDLKHEQQLTEILANIFTDIYTAESTISRVQQNIESGNKDRIPLYIAKVFAAEASIRLLNMALTGMNGIYKGNLKSSIVEKLKNFQVRMLPTIDIIAMKRMIADHIYSKQAYPF